MYDKSMNKDRIRNLSLGTRLYQFFFFFSRAKIRGKKKIPKLFFFLKKKI